jgi:hypothetical protein
MKKKYINIFGTMVPGTAGYLKYNVEIIMFIHLVVSEV